jgi:L-alanine-DL-glutamate epimerase-like enolase superfamily enzyme
LGFAINSKDAAATARGFVDEGYTATKWFVRNGPMDGESGARKNVELVRTLREAVGPDVDIMIDAWNSWDVRYALDMANRMAEFRPRWLEEVVPPDDIKGQARVNALSPVPISGGEHEYTRWGAREYFEAGAVDVYQADTVWAGGVSEMLKIFAMASAFGVEVIPHGGAVPINAHLTAAQSPALTPLIEYLVHWNEVMQLFWKDPVKPVNGYITVSDLPGLGLEVDDAKVESRQTLDWS